MPPEDSLSIVKVNPDNAKNQLSLVAQNNKILAQVSQILLIHFPDKANEIMKDQEAQKEKKEAQNALELEKDIARHFKATYIRLIENRV
jgi:predicted metal-binding protein